MCPIEFSGFDQFKRHLRQVADVLSDLDGSIGEVSLRSTHPEDVAAAISEMEAAVDARAGNRVSNPTIHQLVEAMKEQYANAIRERAQLLALEQQTKLKGEDESVPTDPVAQTPNAPAPKAFLSHSHEDKDFIVRPLDKLLREGEGIDAWLDERDMPAGADIVDAIFTQGLGGADAVVVVLMPNSIGSRWVHEELSVAVVRKIKKRVKTIIPVVYGISDDDVPDPLAATNWIRLKDTSAEELAACAKRIGSALHGLLPAPVAPAPSYAGIPIHRLPSLTANDERLFAEACREYAERDYYHPAVDVQNIVNYGSSIGIEADEVVESLQALQQRHYVKDLQYYMGSGRVPAHFQITDFGFEAYLTSYKADDYRRAKSAVLSEIVNKGAHDLRMIVSTAGVPETIARHIVRQIESRGHARVSWHSGGASIMPESTLKRLLEE